MSAAFALLDHLPIRAWDHLLFVECGDGRVAEEAWRRVTKGYVCGLDRSHGLVDLARRLRGVPGKLVFETWDGRQLPCSDGAFDHVVCSIALDGSREAEALRQELRRVTRLGGRIYVVEPAFAPAPDTLSTTADAAPKLAVPPRFEILVA